MDTPKWNLTVYVYQRPHMRSSSLEYLLQVGRGVLVSIFDKMEMRPDVKTLQLVFPENMLNIIEQRVLYKRLAHYCPNLTEVTIYTQSVYIIQCTDAKNCRIVTVESALSSENDPIDAKLWSGPRLVLPTFMVSYPSTGNVE